MSAVRIENGTAITSPVCQPRPMVHARKVAIPPSIATLTAVVQPSAPITNAGEKPATTIIRTEMTMDLVLSNSEEVIKQ